MLLAFRAHTFPRVLSNVYTKLNDVSRQHFTGRTLLRATAQPLAVYEGSIAAFSVLQVELQTQKCNRLECAPWILLVPMHREHDRRICLSAQADVHDVYKCVHRSRQTTTQQSCIFAK